MGPGAALVLLAQGWVPGSAGVAQRVQNSSVVLPNLCCAVINQCFSIPDSELIFMSFCGSVLHQREGEEHRVKKRFEVLIYLK